jgi:hypothetical protein
MNDEMKKAWAEIGEMLVEPTPIELDVFLRTWQRAIQAEREAIRNIVEDEIKRIKPTYSPTADIILRRICARGQA